MDVPRVREGERFALSMSETGITKCLSVMKQTILSAFLRLTWRWRKEFKAFFYKDTQHSIGWGVLPPPVPMPLVCTPAGMYTGCRLETVSLLRLIHLLLWVLQRSQAVLLLSKRFQRNINLPAALTASSHLFTKINFKHTLETNS